MMRSIIRDIIVLYISYELLASVMTNTPLPGSKIIMYAIGLIGLTLYFRFMKLTG